MDHYGKDGRRMRVEGSATRTAAKSLSPERQAQFVMAWRQTGERLRQSGFSPAQVGQVCAAAVGHCAHQQDKGPPEQVLVSKDGQRLGVMHPGRQLSEMDMPQALQRSTEEHLAAASQTGGPTNVPPQQPSSRPIPVTSPAGTEVGAPALG